MNPMEILQNANKMREEMEKLQKDTANMTATGSSGGKMVTVTVNGKLEITACHIDPICVDKSDVKMLEDLVVAACHAAMERMKDDIKDRFAPLLASMS